MKTRLYGALLALTALSANAHTPYLHATGDVAANGGTVSMEAAFAETFFIPEVAFNDSQFVIIGPDGQHHQPDKVAVWKARTLAEHTLGDTPGTWRFSTGSRYGALFRTWEVNGKRETSRDRETKIPAGAKVIADFQSLTLAETYLTVGAPNRTVLAPYGKGLEIEAIDHPTDVYVGEQFRFRVLHDGKALPNHAVEITQVVNDTGNLPKVVKLTTDADGIAVFKPELAAVWLALVRYRTPAPASAGVSEYSNSYTLTFRSLAQ